MPLETGDNRDRTCIAELNELAERYGTPFFLYDADAVSRRINLTRDSLQHLAKVFYAVKANPNLELLRAVRGVADGLDVSSGGELEQASLAGFDMVSVSFAGPAKTTAELTGAIKDGVGCISIESRRELMECVNIARRLGAKANVVVRVNPKVPNRSFGLKMGGRPIQFGIDEEEIGDVSRTILANDDTLSFQGIHVYAGSQCFEPASVVEGVQNTFWIAREIETSTGLSCRTI